MPGWWLSRTNGSPFLFLCYRFCQYSFGGKQVHYRHYGVLQCPAPSARYCLFILSFFCECLPVCVWFIYPSTLSQCLLMVGWLMAATTTTMSSLWMCALLSFSASVSCGNDGNVPVYPLFSAFSFIVHLLTLNMNVWERKREGGKERRFSLTKKKFEWTDQAASSGTCLFGRNWFAKYRWFGRWQIEDSKKGSSVMCVYAFWRSFSKCLSFFKFVVVEN